MLVWINWRNIYGHKIVQIVNKTSKSEYQLCNVNWKGLRVS
jgi:hypothetical protein